MLIHRIFHRPRIKNRSARGRRVPNGLCLRLECLENRTPLSSGLVVGIEAAIASQVVEIGSVMPGSPLHLEQASIEATRIDQVIATVSSEIRFTSLTLSENPSTTSSSAAVETFLSPQPAGAVPSTISLAAGSDGIVGQDPGGNRPRPIAAAIAQLDPNQLLTAAGAEDDGDMPPFPWIGPLIGLTPARGSSQTNNNDDQPSDMSYVGSLESIELDDGFSPWTATQLATARATGHMLSFVVTDPSLQVDAKSEGTNSSGLSYLATDGGETLNSPTPVGDSVLARDDDSTEPMSPASITVSGVSLNALLYDQDLPIKTVPGALVQVVELVPLPESSLALTATLWTVPSDSPPSSVERDASAGRAVDPDGQEVRAASWVLFVTGTDQALEQTSRDIRDGMFAHCPRRAASEGPGTAPDELIEWQGPLLPGARAGLPETKTKSPRISRDATSDEPGLGTLQTRRDPRPQSDEGQPVVLGVMPMISAVSITTMIAGWFWRKRQRLHCPGRRKSRPRAR